jgi:hypothetical protein
MTWQSGNEFQDLCTMFGLTTLTWAWAENVLAMTIGIINKYAGPIKGYPEPPLALKKRVSCLKIALRDITVLHPLQEDGRILAKRFKELSMRRNDLVHSAAWQHHEGGFEAIGLHIQRGDYMIKNHRFNVSDAISLNVEISKLSDDATAFMLRVCKIFDAP